MTRDVGLELSAAREKQKSYPHSTKEILEILSRSFHRIWGRTTVSLLNLWNLSHRLPAVLAMSVIRTLVYWKLLGSPWCHDSCNFGSIVGFMCRTDPTRPWIPVAHKAFSKLVVYVFLRGLPKIILLTSDRYFAMLRENLHPWSGANSHVALQTSCTQKNCIANFMDSKKIRLPQQDNA